MDIVFESIIRIFQYSHFPETPSITSIFAFSMDFVLLCCIIGFFMPVKSIKGLDIGKILQAMQGEINIPIIGFFFKNSPYILVNLGLIGTFLGVSISLLDFNSNSISESIPKLIDGMKTSFLTSFLGISYSLICYLLKKLKTDINSKEITLVEMNPVILLHKIQGELQKLVEEERIRKDTYNEKTEQKISFLRSLAESNEKMRNLLKEKSDREINGYPSESLDRLQEILEGMQSQQATLMQDQKQNMVEMNSLIISMNSELSDHINKTLLSANDQILNLSRENIENLDKSIEKEINKVVNQLSSGLKQIVENFVDEMDEIVKHIKMINEVK